MDAGRAALEQLATLQDRPAHAHVHRPLVVLADRVQLLHELGGDFERVLDVAVLPSGVQSGAKNVPNTMKSGSAIARVMWKNNVINTPYGNRLL